MTGDVDSHAGRNVCIGRIADMLEALRDSRSGLSLDDLCAATGLCRRQVLRYVEAFEIRGLIARDLPPRPGVVQVYRLAGGWGRR